MAGDMFLKLAGVKGESTDDKHGEEIQVLSWSWGMTQPGSMHDGTGGGQGKVAVQDLSITKYLDKSSPTLELFCCQGDHVDEAVLTLRKAGGSEALEYFKITMKKVIITSISLGGAGGDDKLTEHLSLNFAEFKTEYTPQKSEGGGGDATVEAGWNIASSKKV